MIAEFQFMIMLLAPANRFIVEWREREKHYAVAQKLGLTFPFQIVIARIIKKKELSSFCFKKFLLFLITVIRKKAAPQWSGGINH